MTDKPILFSGPMIRALLEGRKTQTRRVLKPQPVESFSTFSEYADAGIERRFLIPHAPGWRLWVREAHYLTDDGESEYAVFAADEASVKEHFTDMQATMASHPSIDWSKHLRLRPSIHMPRWASRLTLIVTDVRVQRLQEISEADAIAEGMTFPHGMEWGCDPVDAFRTLWNSLNADRGFGWDANPWVSATTFTVHKCNIDLMEDAA